MNKYLFLLVTTFGLLAQSRLSAQVPQLINYQGRIVVGGTSGTNFNGTGQFKFALVNSSASVTYWSNDGSSSAGSQPAAAVALDVGRGLYSLQLGDTGLANMSALPASIFTNSSVWLRVWFNDGTNGSQLLSPDQRIGAVGYSLMAANVPDALITSTKLADNAVIGSKLANGAVTTAKLVDGSVNTAKLATGSVGATQLSAGAAAANLQASGQAGVASGGMILSQQPNATNLINAGYLNIGRVLTAEAWDGGSLANAPSGRVAARAVWTGSEVIVWGGFNPTALGTGARFNPLANTWTALPTNGAPAARYYHAAVWTGSEVIIWGGYNGTVLLNTGGRYNPIANTWTPISTNGAPSARDEMWDAVWTGSEMLVWGGWDGTKPVNTGGRYNPTTDSWTSIPTNGAPTARYDHAAAWTGTELILWGGYGTSSVLNSGGRYNPVSNTWIPITTSNAPAARYLHASVWTGTEMIIWGGRAGNLPSTVSNTGGRYNPSTDTWADVSTVGVPSPREDTPLRAIWSGSEMFVWGGYAGSVPQSTGGRYNPLSNTWKAITDIGAPSARLSMGIVWTGQSMILFGGTEFVNYFGDTYLYTPSRSLYLYQKP